ncbi:DUF6918 family protein [Corynebacterium hindlerae]|uniref:DUF6918 family protein n=1 Tax=Corynebacterium hindlerae TaxID=699041 RepID=UPI0031B66EFA
MITINDRAALVTDLANFVRTTIESQTGIAGMALKGGLTAATKAKADIVEAGVERVLDEMLEILAPYWDSKPADTSFGKHLEAHSEEISDKLMATADRQAEKLYNSPLTKLYGSIRGKAANVVAENVGGLGEVVEKHAG